MIRILLLLMPFAAFGQQIPNFSVNQSIELRKIVKLTADSVRKQLTDSFAMVPRIRKGTLDTLNNLSKYLSGNSNAELKAYKDSNDIKMKSLDKARQVALDSIGAVNARLALLTERVKAIEVADFGKAINAINQQVAAIKQWMDRVKAFNWQ